MLTLYHAPTAVCAAKVRVVLADKNLPFESHMINLHSGEQFNPEYMKLNPNAVVPTLIHDGNVLIESTVINEYLDESFADKPLRPTGALGHARIRLWTKKEDMIHDAINTMTATMIFRHDLLQKTPEERAARYSRMPDPARREKWKKMMEDGLDSPIFIEALVRFARHFRDMEKALANGPWLAGDQFTLADAGLLSFFYRLDMLQCTGLWREHFPKVSGWYERCKARPSFQQAIIDFIPAEDNVKFTKVATPLWPKVNAAYAKAMNAI